MRRSQRLALQLALLLALGTLFTVSIAWGIEVIDARQARSAVFMTGAPGNPFNGWMFEVPEEWPEQPVSGALVGQGGRIDPATYRLTGAERLRIRQGIFTGVSSSPTGVAFINDDPAIVIERYEVGWPVRTMARRGTDDTRPRASGLTEILRSGVLIGGGRSLPLRPIWAPFLGSVVGWAAAFAAAWLAARAARALLVRHRRGRGGCPACGYDWAALPICPECGAARSGAEPC